MPYLEQADPDKVIKQAKLVSKELISFINKGYKFNNERIELLKKDFYKNYGKEADKNFL